MASFGALTMLIIQYVLGMAYNLFGRAPSPGKPVGLFSSPLLALHVVVGILLVVAAVGLVIRAAQARARAILIPSVIGLLAIIGAGVNGVLFASHGANGSSMGMAVSAGVAILCYAVSLVVAGKPREDKPA